MTKPKASKNQIAATARRARGFKLFQQLQTVEALVSGGRRQLERGFDPGGKILADATRADELRSIQSDLEDAERLLAVTAQDIADLE